MALPNGLTQYNLGVAVGKGGDGVGEGNRITGEILVFDGITAMCEHFVHDSFKDRETEKIFHHIFSRKLPADVQGVLRWGI